MVWRLCCYILRRLMGKEKGEYFWVVDINGYIWPGSSTRSVIESNIVKSRQIT